MGPGNPLAKVLAESGFVNQRELGDAARVKVERILADVLSWDSGSFEFEDGVLPKGAVDLKLSTERLLLAAVQRIPDRSFALRHVELSTVLEPAPEGEAALSEVRAEVWPLLERLDGHAHPEGRHRPHPPRRVRGRQDRLRDAVPRHRAPPGRERRGARPRGGSAERVRRGAGAAVHGADGSDPGVPSLPAAEPTGFAFTEPEPAFPSGRARPSPP